MKAKLAVLKSRVEFATGFVFGYERVADYVQVMPSQEPLNRAYLLVFPATEDGLACIAVRQHCLYFGRP